jgi:hypothetical protein
MMRYLRRLDLDSEFIGAVVTVMIGLLFNVYQYHTGGTTFIKTKTVAAIIIFAIITTTGHVLVNNHSDSNDIIVTQPLKFESMLLGWFLFFWILAGAIGQNNLVVITALGKVHGSNTAFAVITLLPGMFIGMIFDYFHNRRSRDFPSY